MQVMNQRASAPNQRNDTALHVLANRFISRFAQDRVNIQTLPFSSPQIRNDRCDLIAFRETVPRSYLCRRPRAPVLAAIDSGDVFTVELLALKSLGRLSQLFTVKIASYPVCFH